MTPADVLAELGRGIGWGVEQVLFTTGGWWIIAGALAAWAVIFTVLDQRRQRGLREARERAEAFERMASPYFDRNGRPRAS